MSLGTPQSPGVLHALPGVPHEPLLDLPTAKPSRIFHTKLPAIPLSPARKTQAMGLLGGAIADPKTKRWSISHPIKYDGVISDQGEKDLQPIIDMFSKNSQSHVCIDT